MASAVTKRRAGADDQKLAQAAVVHLGDAPERRLPLVELWRGVSPRKAPNSRPLAKALISWIVAAVAEAATGPRQE